MGVNKRPFLATIVMLAIVNIILLLFVAGVAQLIDSTEYGNYALNIIHALQWMVIPSSVLVPNNIGIKILSVLVFIIGLVLFSGTIIALTTTHIRNYITRKSTARGKLNMSGHYVVLNYNNKLPTLLREMSYNNIDDTVLILSHKDKTDIKGLLRYNTLTTKPNSKVNIVVRQGNPHNLSELEDVALQHSKAILIVHDNANDVSDMNTVGLLLSIGSNINVDTHIVIEAHSNQLQDMIQKISDIMPTLQDKDIISYCSNQKIGQFLALSIIRPQLVRVVYDLLSFVRLSIYDSDYYKSIDNYLYEFTNSLPIICEHNKVFVLANNRASILEQRKTKLPSILQLELVKASQTYNNCYIYGHNDKYQYMMQELMRIDDRIICKNYDLDRLDDFVADIGNDSNAVAVILSTDNNDDNVLRALITISGKYGIKPSFGILVHISNPNNQINVEQFGIDAIIVSNKIVSFFAMQNLVKKNAHTFYQTLLSYGVGEFNLCIDRASLVVQFGNSNMYFDSYLQLVLSIYSSSMHKILPIGVAYQYDNLYFCNGLDIYRQFELNCNDNLIYIRYS
ncbi:MAG: DUF423 domain-containing protein [Clostridiales bacterium]|nr:DUF423 domain-containing protein [Clostridiales bacterium]